MPGLANAPSDAIELPVNPVKPASFKSRVILAMGATLVCLIVLIIFTGRYYTQLLEAQAWSTHTYQVLASLRELEAATDADRGLPYCAATGDRVFRRVQQPPFDYEARYRQLADLVRGDGSEIQHLNRFDALWSHWTSEYLVPIQAYCDLPSGAARGGPDELNRLVAVGSSLRGQLLGELSAMERREEGLLGTRQDQLARLQLISSAVLGILATVTVLLAVVMGTSLARAASRLDRLNKELENEAVIRRGIEKRLTHSEERVRTILNNVPDA